VSWPEGSKNDRQLSLFWGICRMYVPSWLVGRVETKYCTVPRFLDESCQESQSVSEDTICRIHEITMNMQNCIVQCCFASVSTNVYLSLYRTARTRCSTWRILVSTAEVLFPRPIWMEGLCSIRITQKYILRWSSLWALWRYAISPFIYPNDKYICRNVSRRQTPVHSQWQPESFLHFHVSTLSLWVSNHIS